MLLPKVLASSLFLSYAIRVWRALCLRRRSERSDVYRLKKLIRIGGHHDSINQMSWNADERLMNMSTCMQQTTSASKCNTNSELHLSVMLCCRNQELCKFWGCKTPERGFRYQLRPGRPYFVNASWHWKRWCHLQSQRRLTCYCPFWIQPWFSSCIIWLELRQLWWLKQLVLKLAADLVEFKLYHYTQRTYWSECKI